MSQVYSISMFQQHDLSGVGPSVGPRPGYIWVLRDLDVVNGEALNQVSLVGPAGQLIWAHSFATPVGFDYASWRGRCVIEPSEQVFIESTAAADVTLSGYQLTLP